MIRYPAQIDRGERALPLRECTLFDVSGEGAQMRIGQSQDLPDEFTLVLSYDGAARRRCTVMWRSGERLGRPLPHGGQEARTQSKWAGLATQPAPRK